MSKEKIQNQDDSLTRENQDLRERLAKIEERLAIVSATSESSQHDKRVEEDRKSKARCAVKMKSLDETLLRRERTLIEGEAKWLIINPKTARMERVVGVRREFSDIEGRAVAIEKYKEYFGINGWDQDAAPVITKVAPDAPEDQKLTNVQRELFTRLERG